MTYALTESGLVLTETQDGVTMPADYSFAAVNDYVHDHDRHFEELQWLALGMATEIDKLRCGELPQVTHVAWQPAERDYDASCLLDAADRIQELEAKLAVYESAPVVAYQSKRNGFIVKETKNPEYNTPLIIKPEVK